MLLLEEDMVDRMYGYQCRRKVLQQCEWIWRCLGILFVLWEWNIEVVCGEKRGGWGKQGREEET